MTEHTQTTKRVGVAFLCKELNRDVADFANEICRETNYEVFLVIDSWQSAAQLLETDLFTTVSAEDEDCIRQGYVGCNIAGKETHIQKKVIAWDKMLLHFCKYESDIDFLWVFEDDVFIPRVETIKNLTEKYSSNDLVTPNNFYKSDSIMDWHWPHVVDKIKPPYFYSMVCACGMSRKMLDAVAKYVEQNNRLFYIEVMFNTIAMQDKSMKVSDPLELKSVVWKGEWGVDEFMLLPNSVFHPIKDVENNANRRAEIWVKCVTGYQPNNQLPEFITRLMK